MRGGKPERIGEVVCDMSPAFLAAIGKAFTAAAITVNWFHVVQLFTRAVDDVRKAEYKLVKMPAATRWALLKAADGKLTDKQARALAELAEPDRELHPAIRPFGPATGRKQAIFGRGTVT